MGKYIGISIKLEAILEGWPISNLPTGVKNIFTDAIYTPNSTIDCGDFTSQNIANRIHNQIYSSKSPIWISAEEPRMRMTYFIGGPSEDAMVERLEKIALLV